MNMQPRYDSSLKVIHACGAAGVLACVTIFVIFSAANRERHAQENRALEAAMQQDQDHRQALLVARTTHEKLHANHVAALANAGDPPLDVSLETYVEMIATIASKNKLRIIRHIPLQSRTYPGLFVRQFSIEVSGTFADLMEFLRTIEEINYWADVSHFKIDKPAGSAMLPSRVQSALVTFALFSAEPERTGGGA